MPRTKIDIQKGIRERLRSGMFDVNALADDMGLSPKTIYKHMSLIKNEQNSWLDFLAQGGYINKFKQTLDTFDYQAQALLTEMGEMRATYKTRNLQLQEEFESVGENDRKYSKTVLLQSMINNDNNYFSNIERYRRFIKDVEKESLMIQSKTSTVWAFKRFVQQNTPTPMDDPRDTMISDIIDEGGTFDLPESGEQQ